MPHLCFDVEIKYHEGILFSCKGNVSLIALLLICQSGIPAFGVDAVKVLFSKVLLRFAEDVYEDQ